MTIDFVVNLWNSKINEQNMFTIRTKVVSNTDMNFNSVYVAYRNKFSKNMQTISSFLTKDNKHIHAIALLNKAKYAFPEIVLNAKTLFIIINEKIQEIIKTNLVDLVVYATKEPYDNCNIFTNLYH